MYEYVMKQPGHFAVKLALKLQKTDNLLCNIYNLQNYLL